MTDDWYESTIFILDFYFPGRDYLNLTASDKLQSHTHDFLQWFPCCYGFIITQNPNKFPPVIKIPATSVAEQAGVISESSVRRLKPLDEPQGTSRRLHLLFCFFGRVTPNPTALALPILQ